MTPEELAANSAAIQQMLGELGVTPETALMAEGRQRAWQRFEQPHARATELGQGSRVAAIEARVERDATTHARRQMARIATAATAGERMRSPAARNITPQLPATLTGMESTSPRNPTEAFIEDTPGS